MMSAMERLTISGSMPVGKWRKRMGLLSLCQFCRLAAEENTEHSLSSCEWVQETWVHCRTLRMEAAPEPKFEN